MEALRRFPYIFEVPNQRKQHTAITTNQGSARAWRAPNHPQAALITMAAFEDVAAKLKMDPAAMLRANMDILGPRAKTYAEELEIAEQLMGWKQNWHPRADKTAGAGEARAGAFDPHLGRPRPQQRSGPEHSSRWFRRLEGE